MNVLRLACLEFRPRMGLGMGTIYLLFGKCQTPYLKLLSTSNFITNVRGGFENKPPNEPNFSHSLSNMTTYSLRQHHRPSRRCHRLQLVLAVFVLRLFSQSLSFVLCLCLFIVVVSFF